MRIAFIARSTLYKIHGGSAVQILETAKQLQKLGVEVDIRLAHEKINYDDYNLLHFFDITRPANILYHIKKTKKPFVITPILVDYGEYDKEQRGGVAGFLFRVFPSQSNEYLKTVARWMFGKDSLPGKSYLWKGQKRSIREIFSKAILVIPNSISECAEIKKRYNIDKDSVIVPNGVDTELFTTDSTTQRGQNLIICAARIEGIKNQLNLIRAMNNTAYKLILIGGPAPNQAGYYKQCREIAAANIEFVGNISQPELVEYYAKAKVHILPSWFETCGLSSLEAAAMGCNIVVSNRGFTKDYFGDEAFYCDPSSIESIINAVTKAVDAPAQINLQKRVRESYTWEKAAFVLRDAYIKLGIQ